MSPPEMMLVYSQAMFGTHMPFDFLLKAEPAIHAGAMTVTPANKVWFHVGTESVTTTLDMTQTYDYDGCLQCGCNYASNIMLYVCTGGTPVNWLYAEDWTASPDNIFVSTDPHGGNVTWTPSSITDQPVLFSVVLKDNDFFHPGAYAYLSYTNSNDDDVTVTSTNGVKAYRVGADLAIVGPAGDTDHQTIWEGEAYGVVLTRTLSMLSMEGTLPRDEYQETCFDASYTMLAEPSGASVGGNICAPVNAFSSGPGCYLEARDYFGTSSQARINISIPVPGFPFSISMPLTGDPDPEEAFVGLCYALGSTIVRWNRSVDLEISPDPRSASAHSQSLPPVEQYTITGTNGHIVTAGYKLKSHVITIGNGRSVICYDSNNRSLAGYYNPDFRLGVPYFSPSP